MTTVIPRENRRITYSSEIRKLKQVSFSSKQKALIEGCLLGDGCLTTSWGANSNYRFMITHSIKQQEYILWKYEQLKPFVLTPPRLYKPTQALSFRTISHPMLTMLRQSFYPNDKKILPDTITCILQNPLSLAVWFMDDGNAIVRSGKIVGYHLNTQSFSLTENRLLVELLKELYGINANVERNRNSYRVAIWQKDSRKIFRSIVKRYMLPLMRYKLG